MGDKLKKQKTNTANKSHKSFSKTHSNGIKNLKNPKTKSSHRSSKHSRHHRKKSQKKSWKKSRTKEPIGKVQKVNVCVDALAQIKILSEIKHDKGDDADIESDNLKIVDNHTLILKKINQEQKTRITSSESLLLRGFKLGLKIAAGYVIFGLSPEKNTKVKKNKKKIINENNNNNCNT